MLSALNCIKFGFEIQSQKGSKKVGRVNENSELLRSSLFGLWRALLLKLEIAFL